MKRNLTDTARAKMSAAAKAQMANTTARTRLSEANRGENNPMFGRTLSEATRAKMRGRQPSPEARAKMAAARQGRKHSDEARGKMSAAVKAAWARRRAAKETTEGEVQ